MQSIDALRNAAPVASDQYAEPLRVSLRVDVANEEGMILAVDHFLVVDGRNGAAKLSEAGNMDGESEDYERTMNAVGVMHTI